MSMRTRLRAPAPTLVTGALPGVNLLSPAVLEVVHLQQVRRRMIAAGVAVVAVTGLLFTGQQGLVMAAQRDLDTAQSQNAALTATKHDLAPVGRFYAEVQANQDALMTAMAKETLHSQTLGALRQAAPADVVVTTAALTVDTAIASGAQASTVPCPGPDPYDVGAAVGCVTVVGQSPSREALGQFVENLSGTETFVNAFVSATTVDDSGQVSFTATVGLTESVYSNRYRDSDFLKGADR